MEPPNYAATQTALSLLETHSMEAKIHFRSRASATSSEHGTQTDGEEFSGELQERSLAAECGPSEVEPSSSDACEVHGDGVADPELAFNKTPGGITDDRATATWIRERAGVTVSTFQPMAILPSVRHRLSPQNLQLLEKGASDDALLGECISDKIDQDVCWWRILYICHVPDTSPYVQRYATSVIYDSRQHYRQWDEDHIGNTENTAVNAADAQRAMQRMQISSYGNTRSHNAAPLTRSVGTQTESTLRFWDTRGDLTWSVTGGSREAASGIMHRVAGFYDEAVLGHDGSRRVLRFPNFAIDAEWHRLQQQLFAERFGVNAFGSDGGDTSSGDDDDDNEWSWYEEDMQAASNNAWDNDAGDDMYRWG